MENRFIENFQIIVDEAHGQDHSSRWNAAVNDLRRVHPDLPDVATLAARKLPAADSKMLAHRLSNTATREIAGIGKERLSDAELAMAVRRTHRSVAIQEAANHVLLERDKVSRASDFLSLKAAVDPGRENQSGLVAIETLKRQGIDARRMFEGMKPAELKAVSVGSYDRVSDENRDRLTAALESNIDSKAEHQTTAERSPPAMRPARTQFSAARRQPSFGRRMSQNAHAAMAMDGVGI